MKHAPPRTPTLVNKCMDSRRIRDPESVRQFSIICKCSFCVQGTSQPIRKDRNKTPRSNLRPPRKRGERKRTGRAGGQVGCGTGRLLRKLAAQLKPGFTVRIDISPAMIKISKGNLAPSGEQPRIQLVIADAHKTPLRGQSTDLIISTGTLHHIRRPTQLFTESTRILRRKGEAWIYEFSHDACYRAHARGLGIPSPLTRLVAALHGLPRSTFETGYIHKALEEAHCKVTVEYEGPITKLALHK